MILYKGYFNYMDKSPKGSINHGNADVLTYSLNIYLAIHIWLQIDIHSPYISSMIHELLYNINYYTWMRVHHHMEKLLLFFIIIFYVVCFSATCLLWKLTHFNQIFDRLSHIKCVHRIFFCFSLHFAHINYWFFFH